mmetsp:Transcript_2174/g.5518  ORF Transcript_2174/g.5518 Transcript_2174/m.5518 type:complete len:589 (+) Transcript_2174:585-2351(+)
MLQERIVDHPGLFPFGVEEELSHFWSPLPQGLAGLFPRSVVADFEPETRLLVLLEEAALVLSNGPHDGPGDAGLVILARLEVVAPVHVDEVAEGAVAGMDVRSSASPAEHVVVLVVVHAFRAGADGFDVSLVVVAGGTFQSRLRGGRGDGCHRGRHRCAADAVRVGMAAAVVIDAAAVVAVTPRFRSRRGSRVCFRLHLSGVAHQAAHVRSHARTTSLVPSVEQIPQVQVHAVDVEVDVAVAISVRAVARVDIGKGADVGRCLVRREGFQSGRIEVRREVGQQRLVDGGRGRGIDPLLLRRGVLLLLLLCLLQLLLLRLREEMRRSHTVRLRLACIVVATTISLLRLVLLLLLLIDEVARSLGAQQATKAVETAVAMVVVVQVAAAAAVVGADALQAAHHGSVEVALLVLLLQLLLLVMKESLGDGREAHHLVLVALLLLLLLLMASGAASVSIDVVAIVLLLLLLHQGFLILLMDRSEQRRADAAIGLLEQRLRALPALLVVALLLLLLLLELLELELLLLVLRIHHLGRRSRLLLLCLSLWVADEMEVALKRRVFLRIGGNEMKYENGWALCLLCVFVSAVVGGGD